jgi:hypothetical protein
MSVIVRQPRSLPSFAYQKMAEGTRFENLTAPDTIGSNLVSSFGSQSLTAESDERQGMNRYSTIGPDSSATIEPQPYLHPKKGGSKFKKRSLGTLSILMGDTRILPSAQKPMFEG